MEQKVPEQKFALDDLVSHKTWGIGRIRDVIIDPEPSIIVDFLHKPNHRMSLQLANQALTRLPSDGLEVLLAKDPDRIVQWSDSAPLKLIAAALTDLGKIGTPSQIRESLGQHHVLGNRKWESWWKLVQPELIKSSHFTYFKSRRAYGLLTQVEDVPMGRVVPQPKKVPKSTIGKDQVLEVISKLEAGEITFQDIRGEKRFRSIIKKLVKRSKESELAKRVIAEALLGPLIPVRSIFRELLARGRVAELMEYVVQLTRSIGDLIVAQAEKKRKKVVEHISTKLNLLREITEDLAEQIQCDKLSLNVSAYVRALIDLALVLCRKNITGWRSEALAAVSAIMAIMGRNKISVYECAGQYLAGLRGAKTERMIVTEGLLTSATSAGTGVEAVDALLTGSLHVRSDYARKCLLRYIKPEQQLEWVTKRLSRISHPFESPAVDMLADILVAMPEQGPIAFSRDYLLVAITLASLSPQAQVTLYPVIQSKLKTRLDIIWEETLTKGHPAYAGDLLGSIEHATLAKGKEERQHYLDRYKKLNSRIADLQKSLAKSREKSAALEDVTRQLQSSFRLPEQWATYRGKKEVLESIALLYQEMFLAVDAGFEGETTGWLRQRLLGLLQRNGVVSFAEVGAQVPYDPSQHRLILGSRVDTGNIVVRCPGFEWQDPNSKRVVLARAIVAGISA
jgi:hypothetical protein